jgi:hypothetical protein
MNAATEQLIMVLDLRTPAKVTKKVNECVKNGQCLACSEKRNGLRRGLCTKCYTQWKTERTKMSDRQALLFDSRLIRIGKLLAVQTVRKIKSLNIFRKMA